MRKLLILALLCPFFSKCQPLSLTGKVVTESGEPVAGATIAVHPAAPSPVSMPYALSSDARGAFALKNLSIGDTLLVTAVGFAAERIVFNESLVRHPELTVTLKRRIGLLDETVIIAYGTTTRRIATGSVSKVSAADIATRPVSNPIAALQGLIPGLTVAQNNGLPGSVFSVLVRGTASLKQGTQPLYIVDGIPFTLNGNTLSSLMPANQSVFNTINPADIESIEVLKDADATAIYGSQGAAGVVLITTKRGKGGDPKLALSFYTGFGRVTRTMKLLNTQEYLQMRRQAFAADGVTPTVSTAPDLLVWDTTRYTDWQAELIGGTARTANYQASFSGASGGLTYLVSASHYRETTVFRESNPSTRSSARISLGHNPGGKSFGATFTASYTVDGRDLPFSDLTAQILLPPNAPALLDSAGNLAWTSGLDNPFAYRKQAYKTRTSSLLGDAGLQYRLFKGAVLKLNLGYNATRLEEQRQIPIAALRPSTTATGSLTVANAGIASWLAEPQFAYKTAWGKHGWEALLGASFQERVQSGTSLAGTGFTTDDLIGTITGAATITASNSYSQYKYAAIFSRLSYNYNRKYILNLNIRRDGSSRYGPAARFSTFGAVGAAWLFSEEAIFKKALSFITYGKLRGSWGITGNDQVGDYQFFDAWTTSTTYLYSGVAGILPSRLFNATYQWEKTRKGEAALELGIGSRLLFSVAYYNNRSSNQLVNYKLPSQTGFTAILQNLDAVIENSGTEWQLETTPVSAKDFVWKSNLNLSFPRNRLVSYPGLTTSTDKLNFAIGQPVTNTRTFTYTGIDPATGLYTFLDVDGDGKISSPADLTNVQPLGPKYYGGWQNSVTCKSWRLSFLIYGTKQRGRNYLYSLSAAPGLLSNQPAFVTGAWQKPGDPANVQKLTALPASATATAFSRYRSSDAVVSDASFLRLRNASLTWTFPKSFLQKHRLSDAGIYVEAQNLLTITPYRGADPETQSLFTLPPLRTIAVGFQLTF